MSTNSKREFWIRHLEMAKHFKGSQQSYCSKKGLQIHTFRYWKGKLNSERPMGTQVSENLPFIPIEILRQSQAPEAPTALPDAKWVAEFLGHLFRQVL